MKVKGQGFDKGKDGQSSADCSGMACWEAVVHGALTPDRMCLGLTLHSLNGLVSFFRQLSIPSIDMMHAHSHSYKYHTPPLSEPQSSNS